MNVKDMVSLISCRLRSVADEIWGLFVSSADKGEVWFRDRISEKDICPVIFKDVNCFIEGTKEFGEIAQKNRLHLNPHCPKRKGRYARPDAVFLENGKVVLICELKIHRFGNDCELFNGVVQLKEYLALYGGESTMGVLLILGCLTEEPNPDAYKFLASLSEGDVVILYANLKNRSDVKIVQFVNGHEVGE